MPAQPIAEKDRSLAVNPSKVPWLVTSVEAQEGFRLKVRFIDGVQGLVDMSAFIHSPKAGVFSVLADPAIFAQAHVEHDAVAWPGDLDLAPDAMHRAICEKGVWDLS